MFVGMKYKKYLFHKSQCEKLQKSEYKKIFIVLLANNKNLVKTLAIVFVQNV
jgi:hypothetical protein